MWVDLPYEWLEHPYVQLVFEILLSSKAMLAVLPPTFKPVLQQIRLLQVASILTSDWITLRGSHAIHGSNALAVKQVCLGLVKRVTSSCTGFVELLSFFCNKVLTR